MNDGMPWRRLERLEPCDQKLLSFAARSLRDHLLRYPDDASGVLLSRSQDPIEDLVLVLGVRPREHSTVRKAILELLEEGFLERSETSISIKNFGRLANTREPAAPYSEIYARDGNRCRYCGATERLSIDHVVPRCQGGSEASSNLVVACIHCNSRKGGRTPDQAGMVLQ